MKTEPESNKSHLMVLDASGIGLSHPESCVPSECPYISSVGQEEVSALDPGYYRVSGGAKPKFVRTEFPEPDDGGGDGEPYALAQVEQESTEPDLVPGEELKSDKEAREAAPPKKAVKKAAKKTKA